MFRERGFAFRHQVIRKEMQSPLRRDRRIEHAHRSSSSIARIRKNFSTLLLLRTIQRLERLARHHHFAAHSERSGHLRFLHRLFVYPQRNPPTPPHIRPPPLTSPTPP